MKEIWIFLLLCGLVLFKKRLSMDDHSAGKREKAAAW
jgi:hypothetical protein